MNLDALLEAAVKLEASDLLIKAFSPPLLRINGDLVAADRPPLSPEEATALVRAAASEADWDSFLEELELDAAYDVPSLGRFRVNFFLHRRTIGAAFRIVPSCIRTMEELALPPVCRSFVERPRGMVIVTGPTGSGKSTSQAAMVDFINEHFPCHIITIEDPIEFVQQNKRALVSQREVGRDTASFEDALRHTLREDPDVILVGEMRDRESVALALQAAETGHLVITTLHTLDAAETVNRIVDVFPTFQQEQVRTQLAMNLLGVISQILVRRGDGQGRVAAFEILVAVPAVRAAIRDNKIYQIPSIIQTGMESGMITLDRSLADLVRARRITYEEGLWRAKHPEEYANLALQAPSETSVTEKSAEGQSAPPQPGRPSRSA